MTREESWRVAGPTLSILQQISAAGYVVSVQRPDGYYVEMHAVQLNGDNDPQIARCNDGAGPEEDYRCAWLLASAVGIDLADDDEVD